MLAPVKGSVTGAVVVVTPASTSGAGDVVDTDMVVVVVVVVVTWAVHSGRGLASGGAGVRQLSIPEVLEVRTVAPALTANT